MESIRKYEILEAIGRKGVVAVIRARDRREGLAIAEAVYRGGIPAIEVAMTVPGAIRVLEALAETYRDRGIVLGAGTVLDPETARSCMLAGAEYFIAPNLDESVARCCNRYALPYMPGVGSVTELVRALELGADVVKLFPGEVAGPRFIRAAHGPIPHARIMPTGGVDPDNLEEWFQAGAFAVGMGSSLTRPKGAREGDMEAVRAVAETVVARIGAIRAGTEAR
jgi:2-dehydro-3-deoxyphosphogluconate aldolase/(4S)-4-hydroxy-2-oxoglutarate aldolase